ncbi:Y+L amino acid transporter 2 [Lepeophtheirus salmonis]|uniref:Y+L amino acid transporter 2 n=1 Tax=Lepeophtheirus salmonis TaxID=72036 RepID=UPI001AE59DF4|nr:Y+L amino acid transporter 2-like [Lepeophtheirus salmonis]XP_040572465.1 Y+L amino acid transporter 2-like [Lepeophtheirus salmonis]XP_040572466.1 Y+L amino acid transporter 2-like [Lepeophtheirus salmonis]XP_040572467.1 Y+L amino acid transporter 2-like [Lepeophtheirus salmonis]XP_040572468.1 Y+L amino acid transporter 2-like [Lepeophtheirus salmonis]
MESEIYPLKQPSSDDPESSNNGTNAPKKDDDSNQIHLKKEINLLEGVAIIVGIIIGSGIFVSPKGVIKEVRSVGMSLVVWVICGIMSMVGALCYAELGTSIPKSGADYAYIDEAFGPILSFLYLWDANFVFVPVTNAIMGLTVANYLIQPLFPDCEIPESALKLIAALCIMGLTYLNCYSTKATTKLQTLFMFTKLFALFLVIVLGIVGFCMNGTSNFDAPFAQTTDSPGEIAVSFYSGIYSYAGWNYLNFMTEELKNPFVNLPRAIYLSLPLVTLVYTLANIAYLSVLTPTEIMASDAIAVTFASKVIGPNWSLVFPVLVAISALGSLSCHIMTSSRLCFVGARKGHFPDALSLITLDSLTPKPALVFLAILSLAYLQIGNIYTLIEYSSFVESMFILITISGLLYMRWKKPDMKRPIKVHLAIPIFFLFVCTFLVFLPLLVRPVEVGGGILITICGIPIYYLCVYWQKKPDFMKKALNWLTHKSQILYLGVKED